MLKVVSHYDLIVLSMSVIGFQNKLIWGGGWGELYKKNLICLAKPLRLSQILKINFLYRIIGWINILHLV